MSQQPYQQPPHAGQYNAAPQSKSGCMKYALIGCLGILVLSTIIGCLGGYWLYNSGRSLIADSMSNVMKSAVAEMNLPESQSQEIQEQIDHVGGYFKDGTLGLADFGDLAKRLQESPVYGAGMTQLFKIRFLEHSGLSEEEKAAGIHDLSRLVHGVQTRQITSDDMNPLTQSMLEQRGSNQRLKETMTDSEIRGFLMQAKQLADSKNLPVAELQEVDYASDFKKIVNDFLAEKGLKPLPETK